MKATLYLAALAAVLAGSTGCIKVNQSPGDSAQALTSVTNLTQRGEIPADVAAVNIENQFGHVRVTGSQTGLPEWSWRLTIRARSDLLAQQAASVASCRLERNGARVRLIVSLPESRGELAFQSDLVIVVPSGVALQSRNQFGATAVSDVTGAIDVTGQNGAVEIRGTPGRVRAQTSFSTLKASDTGPAELKNQNGSVEARSIGGGLTAETSFASLIVSDVRGSATLRNRNGRVEVRTVGGPVDIQNSFGPVDVRDVQGDAKVLNKNGQVTIQNLSGSLDTSTSFAGMDVQSAGQTINCRNQNGAIRVRALSPTLSKLEALTSFSGIDVQVPAGLTPAVYARTSFAEIDSDFPVISKTQGTDPFAGIAPGTPRIRLEGRNGPIRITRH